MYWVRWVSVVVAAAALVGLTSVSAALGATQPASGQFIEGAPTYLSDTMVGGYEVLTLKRDVTVTGSYDGKAKAREVITIRPDGTGSAQIVMDFKGKACGQPAKLKFVISIETDLVTSFSGSWSAFDESGRDGNGSLAGVPDMGGNYIGTMRC
jgi:hypothetical protein